MCLGTKKRRLYILLGNAFYSFGNIFYFFMDRINVVVT